MLNPLQSVAKSAETAGAPFTRTDSEVRRSGDRARLVRSLFRQNNRQLLGFLFARLGSEADAQEVAQEAFVRILELDRPDTIGFLRAYLFRTAANLAADRLRHRAVCQRSEADETFLFEQLLTSPSPERATLGEQQLQVVKTALSRLPAKCCKVCVLHFFEEYTVNQIARELHLSERMVRYYIARGLAQCTNYLDF